MRHAIVLGVVALLGCEDGSGVGHLQRALDLGGGVSIDSVDSLVTGPNAFRRTGTLPVGSSPTITTTLTGLPQGQNYQIQARGTASDMVTVCAGNTAFNVPASGQVTVSITLTCTKPPVGSAAIQGTTDVCPLITGLSAWPAQAQVGSGVRLKLDVEDPDNVRTALTAAWSTTAGTLAGASVNGATLNCTGAGAATVSVTVSDGDPDPACAAHASVSVTCVAGP